MLKNSIRHAYKRLVPISVIIICAFALCLRIMKLYRHELWCDEVVQLSLMKGNFFELLKTIPQLEFCSYISGDLYVLYPFFKIFSYNKWGMAIPNVISTVAGFYILYLICKRYFKSIWAYLITFGIVCLNETLIIHSTELRTYAILPTLALAAVYLFQRIEDLDFKLSTPNRIGAIIFFVLVVLFHVYGILMLASCLLFTLLSRCGEKDFISYFKETVIFTAVVLSLSMPLWLYSMFGPHLGYFSKDFNIFQYIPSPLHDITGFLKGIFCNLIGSKKLYFLLLGIFIPFVFSYEGRLKQLLFLFCNIMIPIGCIFVFDVLGNYWFLQRQFIWVMPLFAFFLGWTWDSLFMLLRRR